MYGDQFGEFVCGYWGLKGLRQVIVRLPLDFSRDTKTHPFKKHSFYSAYQYNFKYLT